MASDIDLDSFNALNKLLGNMPDLVLQASEVAMNKVLLFLHSRIPPYPDQPGQGNWLKFGTPRQQAWFFWAVKTGQPQVRGWKWVNGHPEGRYTRTGSMRRITTKVERRDNEVVGAIGIKSTYAPWVIGPSYPGKVFELGGTTRPMYQAKIHQGRWWQFEQIVLDNLAEAHALFEKELFEAMNESVKKAH